MMVIIQNKIIMIWEGGWGGDFFPSVDPYPKYIFIVIYFTSKMIDN